MRLASLLLAGAVGSFLVLGMSPAARAADLPVNPPPHAAQTVQTAHTAQTAPASAQTGPVSITADTLEYHESDGTYIARGNAEVVRGGVTLSATLITAYVAQLPDGTTDLTHATAEGNVVITSGQNKVVGDSGTYDVGKQVARLTGDHLSLTTPQDTVTATDSLEYWEKEQLAVARGQAVAVRGDRRIAAEVLTALLEKNTQKQDQLDIRRIGAEGGVTITTPTDVARGDRGLYDLKTRKATLDGNVRLTRGGNQLNGARAEVDMTTGISRLLSGGAGQRVRGLVLPRDASTVSPSSVGKGPEG